MNRFTVKRLAEAEKSKRFPLEWKLHICSENNFPTAAGLASSAAGYACLGIKNIILLSYYHY